MTSGDSGLHPNNQGKHKKSFLAIWSDGWSEILLLFWIGAGDLIDVHPNGSIANARFLIPRWLLSLC